MRRFRAFAGASLVLISCSRDEGPCFGLSSGDRLTLELLEVYDESSSFKFDLGRGEPASCGESFDLVAGDVLTVRIVEHVRSDSCDTNRAEVESGAPWPLGPRTEVFPMGAFRNGEAFHVSQAATIAGCAGRWGLELQGRGEPNGADGNPFLVPEPGAFPPIILGRGFIPDALTAECLAFLPASGSACVDYFVVVVHPG